MMSDADVLLRGRQRRARSPSKIRRPSSVVSDPVTGEKDTLSITKLKYIHSIHSNNVKASMCKNPVDRSGRCMRCGGKLKNEERCGSHKGSEELETPDWEKSMSHVQARCWAKQKGMVVLQLNLNHCICTPTDCATGGLQISQENRRFGAAVLPRDTSREGSVALTFIAATSHQV